MATLIGVYRSPNVARIEQDDEARRTLAVMLADGGKVLGSFDGNAGEEDRRYFCGVIADYLRGDLAGRSQE